MNWGRVMMRRKIATTAVGLLVAVALAMVVMAASASAATPRLALKWEGALYSGVNHTSWSLGSFGKPELCLQAFDATAPTNLHRIVDTIEEEIVTECQSAEYSMSGRFTKVTLFGTGLVKAHGTIRMSFPGPCVYSFNSPVATLPVTSDGFSIEAAGSAVGLLVNKESSISCASGKVMPFKLDLAIETPENGTAPLEGEIR
jgi:hypothetical protein